MKSTRKQIVLTHEERTRLEHIASHPGTPQKHVWRAHIILTLGDGNGLVDTMRQTGRSKPTVCRWWDRFVKERVDGLLYDATRLPGKQPISPEKVKRLITLAMSPPPPNRGCWTLKALADKVGNIALSTAHGILKCHGLKPHQVRTFKVSKDPRYELKVKDVVGLYVDPPDHAVVLSADEKPGIQAMGRTQSPLPIKPGQAATQTHDYKRNGTTGLLAALDIATSKVTGRMVDRHRSEEFLSFLD